MTEDWLPRLGDLRAQGRPVALVTVIRVEGSTPRGPGAKMLVTAEGLAWGSIGGGQLEALAIEDAQRALAEGASRVQDYPLCVKSGQCCGGRTEVFIEVMGAGPLLYLFGAGHVGRALCHVLRGTSFVVHLVDPRPDWLHSPDLPPGVLKHGEPWEAFLEGAEWSERVHVAIMTHSHDLDRTLVRALVERPCAYLGLIGSKAKWASFRAALRAHGVPEEGLARVQCPMGLDLGGGKAPQEVAISVAAHLLRLANP